MITSINYVDNRQHLYIPIRLKNGITLQCRPEIFQSCPAVIDTLQKDLSACLHILPPSIHALIRRTHIWVNASYTCGAVDDPRVLKHTAAHHHWQWLEAVHDLPAKAKGVEIYNAKEYMNMRLHWNGCGLILHELCHLIHQLVLKEGLENDEVMNAFGMVLEGGLYDEVIRRDWAFGEEESDAAYATINHKEFFSELSVAFLSRGYDAGLKRRKRERCKLQLKVQQQHQTDHEHGGVYVDRNGDMELCSPPFVALDVLERRKAMGYDDERQFHSLESSSWMQNIQNILTGGVNGHGHCNKFFPFTRGQLKEFDPESFAAFQQLWSEIAVWEDPSSPARAATCKGCLSLPFFLQGSGAGAGTRMRSRKDGFEDVKGAGAGDLDLDNTLMDESTDSASEDLQESQSHVNF